MQYNQVVQKTNTELDMKTSAVIAQVIEHLNSELQLFHLPFEATETSYGTIVFVTTNQIHSLTRGTVIPNAIGTVKTHKRKKNSFQGITFNLNHSIYPKFIIEDGNIISSPNNSVKLIIEHIVNVILSISYPDGKIDVQMNDAQNAVVITGKPEEVQVIYKKLVEG